MSAPLGRPMREVQGRRPALAVDRAVAIASGVGGHVTFNGRAVIIDRTHCPSFIVHGMSGPQVIPLHAIEAVRLRPARAWAKGCLQIVRVGAARSRGGAGDADSVLFDPAQQARFQALAKVLREALEDQQFEVLVTSADEAGEASRLIGLRESGVITWDEFELMKARRWSARRPAPPETAAAPEAAAPPRLGVTTREAREAFVERWVANEAARPQARA